MNEQTDLPSIKFTGFDWDRGNIEKNLTKHKVTANEAEEIFFNQPLFFYKDIKHSQNEERVVAYGVTNNGRMLTVVFTIRIDKIRIISARNQKKKERSKYEK